MNAKLLTRNLRSRIAWTRYNWRSGVHRWAGPGARHLFVTANMEAYPNKVPVWSDKHLHWYYLED